MICLTSTSPGLPITVSPSPVLTGEVIGPENALLLYIRKNTGGRLCEIDSQPIPIEIGHSPRHALSFLFHWTSRVLDLMAAKLPRRRKQEEEKGFKVKHQCHAKYEASTCIIPQPPPPPLDTMRLLILAQEYE